MNNEREAYTYALFTSLRDEGRDLIDVFCAFVLKAIPIDELVGISEIQESLSNDFPWKAKIPLQPLKTILRRAKRQGYVETGKSMGEEKQKGGRGWQDTLYKLTPKGLDYAKGLDKAYEIEKRIDALRDNMRCYFVNKRQIRLTAEAAHKMLLAFVRKNIYVLGQLIHTSGDIFESDFKMSRDNERPLLEYIRFIKERNDEHYSTLREVLYGSIVSVILYDEQAELDKMEKREIKACKVYLDSNFAFSVLGMHFAEEAESAGQLFGLLKKRRFDIRVYDLTVKEMQRVMVGYPLFLQKKGRFPVKGTSFGLYETLEEKGWTASDTREFVREIEETFESKGIKIERVSRETWIKCIEAGKEAEPLLRERKPFQSRAAREHDIGAIELVRKKRGTKVMNIEDSKAFFLTSDYVLSDLNYKNMGHEDGSVCEVILDSLLANILWLKNPDLNFPLETIIAANSRDLFVDDDLWKAFYKKLAILYREGRIHKDDILTLFFDNYISDFLARLSEQPKKEVTDDIIMESILEARKHRKEKEKEQGKATEMRLNELREQLDEVFERLEEKELEINLDRIMAVTVFEEKHRDLMTEFAKLQAKNYVLSLVIIFNLVMFSLSSVMLLSRWAIAGIVVIVITLLFDALKLSNSWPWGDIKRWKFRRVYSQGEQFLEYEQKLFKRTLEGTEEEEESGA